ncbi:MAG: AEC family transporter [Pseudomonadota bacterium]
MNDVLAMALPFFGLIGLGVAAAKIWKIDVAGLAWMNVFIIYIALPALFFNLLSQTAVEELTNWAFIFGATLATYIAFALCFCIGVFGSDGDIGESTIMGLSGAYGNIGYMGPGIAIAAFGEPSVVPVALIFCFDNTLHFVMAPLLMALSGDENQETPLQVAGQVAKRIFTHPFILSTIVGVGAAVIGWQPPEAVGKMLDYLQGAAAPCALFAMGVTVALAERGAFPKVMGLLVPAKLLVHPLIVYVILSWIGDFDPVWVYTAILLAALPTATNVFVIAQQYDYWVSRASSMVIVTTGISIFTVTGLLYAITSGLLPPDLFPG